MPQRRRERPEGLPLGALNRALIAVDALTAAALVCVVARRPGDFRGLQALVALSLILLLTATVAASLLVIRPLERAVKHIRANRELPVTGSREMRILARAYNDMFARHSHHARQLAYSATHDALTGLYNRAGFEALRAELETDDIAVLAMDVDDFKRYNDTYGHDMGDRVLQRVARAVRAEFRAGDAVVRMGGDEFLVVMKGGGTALAGLVEDRMRRVLARLAEPGEGTPGISLSVGVAFGDRSAPRGDVFRDADDALYAAKRGGKGCCAFHGANS